MSPWDEGTEGRPPIPAWEIANYIPCKLQFYNRGENSSNVLLVGGWVEGGKFRTHLITQQAVAVELMSCVGHVPFMGLLYC